MANNLVENLILACSC